MEVVNYSDSTRQLSSQPCMARVWDKGALLVAVCLLVILRVLLASWLPLSFDESYFWLWSKHLAVSYYDHPPLIALAIRLGTLFLGDTPLGVRLVPLVASIAASWAVWRAGAALLQSEKLGGLACCFFNASLMIEAESMGATPDALVLASSALLLLSISYLEESGDGRWWIAIGIALGSALFAKYTGFFLGLSVALWTISTPRVRGWLKTPWPYAAAFIALAFLVPNLWWNAAHDWISFKFQFGRTVSGKFGAQYLLEFVGAQLVLASPFVLIAAINRLWQTSLKKHADEPLLYPALLVWPALIYFTLHALHDRVQGNWPSFVYPGLMILAADCIARADSRHKYMQWCRWSSLPTALAMLAVCYLQTFTGILPLGRQDPISRMTAIGFQPVAEKIAEIARTHHAVGVVTSKYATTGWLAFYLRGGLSVIPLNEDYRWLSVPPAAVWLLRKPLLYVTQNPSHELAEVATHFSHISLIEKIPRKRNSKNIDDFYVYAVSGFHGPAIGHVV